MVVIIMIPHVKYRLLCDSAYYDAYDCTCIVEILTTYIHYNTSYGQQTKGGLKLHNIMQT